MNRAELFPHWRKHILLLFFLLLVAAILRLPTMAAEPEASTQYEERIWSYLMKLTDNPISASGIMGNLYFESNLNPLAVQNADTLTVSPKEYAFQAQTQDYEIFLEDNRGFGLAQWTYEDRKLRLLELADAQGCSIGSLDVQLQLLGEELERYNMLYRISHADSIRFASDYFLINYENPGLQDEAVKEKRAKKGRYYYDKFTKPAPPDDGLTQAQRDVAQIASNSSAYGIPAENGYCMAWVSAVYREAGHSLSPSPSALASARDFSVSTDLTEIPVGAAIYGKKNKKYGHVGLMAENGLVYHNNGDAVSTKLEDWVSIYEGFCWGWPNGIDLTKLP